MSDVYNAGTTTWIIKLYVVLNNMQLIVYIQQLKTTPAIS